MNYVKKELKRLNNIKGRQENGEGLIVSVIIFLCNNKLKSTYAEHEQVRERMKRNSQVHYYRNKSNTTPEEYKERKAK